MTPSRDKIRYEYIHIPFHNFRFPKAVDGPVQNGHDFADKFKLILLNRDVAQLDIMFTETYKKYYGFR